MNKLIKNVESCFSNVIRCVASPAASKNSHIIPPTDVYPI